MPPKVDFPPGVLPVLSEAYGALRQYGPFVIEGYARGETRKVHVELPESQYHVAVKAHDTRYPVRILGTPAKRGRFWVLSIPVNSVSRASTSPETLGERMFVIRWMSH